MLCNNAPTVDGNWDDLRVFLAVARSGRVSAAARQLGVQHTTISRRLSALEHTLGVPLFHRTAVGYRLTPHGEAMVSNVESMERAALAVGARARERSDRIAGRVRIATLEELATWWLAPRLPAFRARYPEIELQIVTGIAPLDLSRGEAELAVRTPRPRQQGLTGIKLARTSSGLYATRSLAVARNLNVEDLDSLQGLPLCTYMPEFVGLQNAAWFRSVLAGANVALTSNNSQTMLAAARAGLGVTVLPRLVARGCDDLVPVSADVGKGDAWLVTHPDFRRDPKVRVTAEFLKAAATGPAGLC